MQRTNISIPESGKYPEAINQLEQAIRLNSHDAKVQFFLGQLLLLNRDRQPPWPSTKTRPGPH